MGCSWGGGMCIPPFINPGSAHDEPTSSLVPELDNHAQCFGSVFNTFLDPNPYSEYGSGSRTNIKVLK